MIEHGKQLQVEQKRRFFIALLHPIEVQDYANRVEYGLSRT